MLPVELWSIETIGWIGGILFAICGIPQAWHSWKHKHSDGLTWAFLTTWAGGEILTLAYVAHKDDVVPLLVNYICNLICLLIILWFKAFPRRT